MTYSHIIVGAGSAGCVLAEYLTRRSSNRVLLLESGPDYVDEADLPHELADGRTPAIGSHDWNLRARGPLGRPLHVPRGRVVGGTSQLNSCIALRPEPTDYVADSGPWSWPHMRSVLKEIESDADFSDDHHGTTGPVPVRRSSEAELTDSTAAFIRSAEACGFPTVSDHNAAFSSGVGPAPLNLGSEGQRVSARAAFLGRARGRTNLDIIANTTARQVVMERRTATGVRCVGEHGLDQTFVGRRIILSLGTFKTPELLLRSGIGPIDQLRQNRIDVVHSLEGVGQNLADHTQVPVVLGHPRVARDTSSPCVQALLRFSSSESQRGATNDMQICLINHVELPTYMPALAASWEMSHAASITSNLMAPAGRGSVRLNRGELCISYTFTSEPQDLERHREGVRVIGRMLSQECFGSLFVEVALPSATEMRDNDSLDRWMLHRIQPGHHPTGTSRMAPDDYRMGVVTEGLLVHGVANLYIADASVIDACVRANTNLAVMAVGRVAGELIDALD